VQQRRPNNKGGHHDRASSFVRPAHPLSHKNRLFIFCDRLDSTGPILSSALFDIPCEQATAALGPGDSLLLYTDGVTEAHGPGGMFGQERLVSAILGGRRGADLLDALLSEVVAFSNSPNNQDDITLLALDLAEPAAVHDGVMGV